MLLVKDIWKAYRKEQVLKGIHFQAVCGEIVGICGANGAGKTTLLSLIASILKPDKGEISLMNISVSDTKAYRRLIGYVPQTIALSPRLTVRQNLDFWASMAGYSGQARKDMVSWAAAMAKTEHFMNKPVGRCSGGMARRANLAAGLTGRPRLVLLDEPTAGIDAENRDIILDSIHSLKQRDCLVLMVNHYTDELERICDRIITLESGMIVEEGAYVH